VSCAIYARVPTGKQDTDNLAQLREFAERMGWHLLAEYVDVMTARHSDRPQFQRTMRDASQ